MSIDDKIKKSIREDLGLPSDEKTALADAEVEYKDHTSNTIYVGFKVRTSKNNLLLHF